MGFFDPINYLRKTYQIGAPPFIDAPIDMNAREAAVQAVCDWADIWKAASGGAIQNADKIWFWSISSSALKMLSWSDIVNGIKTAIGYIAEQSSSPAATKVPVSDSNSKLDAWVSDASESTAGKVQLASTTWQNEIYPITSK